VAGLASLDLIGEREEHRRSMARRLDHGIGGAATRRTIAEEVQFCSSGLLRHQLESSLRSSTRWRDRIAFGARRAAVNRILVVQVQTSQPYSAKDVHDEYRATPAR